MSDLDAAALQQLLHREIPLSRALGVTVRACLASGVILWAPLEPNLNHRQHAFGGSLSTVALLAGYGFAWAMLRRYDLTASVLVQESTTRFLRPVTQDFTATCAAPPSDGSERFLDMMRRRRKGRIALESTIYEAGALAVILYGTYVALAD